MARKFMSFEEVEKSKSWILHLYYIDYIDCIDFIGYIESRPLGLPAKLYTFVVYFNIIFKDILKFGATIQVQKAENWLIQN